MLVNIVNFTTKLSENKVRLLNQVYVVRVSLLLILCTLWVHMCCLFLQPLRDVCTRTKCIMPITSWSRLMSVYTGKSGLVSFIMCVTSGGREVDVGGEGHNRVCCAPPPRRAIPKVRPKKKFARSGWSGFNRTTFPLETGGCYRNNNKHVRACACSSSMQC